MKSAHAYLKINEEEYDSMVAIFFEALGEMDLDDGLIGDIKKAFGPLKELIVYDASLCG